MRVFLFWLVMACTCQAQLMNPVTLSEFIDALPRVDDPAVDELLGSDRIMWYTSAEIPPAIQNWRFTSQPGVHSAQRQPNQNAKNEFPWSHPAGTHLSRQVESIKGVYLPEGRPIVWHMGGVSGYSPSKVYWTFPKDAVALEVLFLRRPDTGELRCFELRTRQREIDAWGVDIFRPYPTRAALAEALQSRNATAEYEQLTQSRKREELLRSRHDERQFRVLATREYVTAWPHDLIDDLLDTAFVSSIGVQWADDADGPTTTSEYHLWPYNYTSSHIGHDRNACMNCHQDTQVHVSFFDAANNRNWGGDVPGSDGILSFHPFEPTSVSTDGTSQPVKMRQQFIDAGIIAEFDKSIHPNTVYRLTKTEHESRQRNVIRLSRYPR